MTDSLDRQLAYVMFRLTLGINILVHGAGRILARALRLSLPPRPSNSAKPRCRPAWCTRS